MGDSVVLETDKLPILFQTMIKNPDTRAHMLFLGPPGSGKTTTAQSFAVALHGRQTNKFASLLFLNSSDERSLETMRQKIYPFVESKMQSLFFTSGEAPPKVIIFDEAETLTDQAQCSLRNLLQRPTSEVILIFICNSLSHIHPQILNKFLIVPFTPTKQDTLQKIINKPVSSLDCLLRRGDIRFFKQCPRQTQVVSDFIFSILHTKDKDKLYKLFTEEGSPFRDRVSWMLLFIQSICPLTTKELRAWSALTASETQPYITEHDIKESLFTFWQQILKKIA